MNNSSTSANTASIEEVSSGVVRISGTLKFETVANLMKQDGARLLAESQLHIDLSGVDNGNSAALAMLLEIIRQRREKNRGTTFSNLPANLEVIAGVYGLTEPLSAFERNSGTART